jgi:predicted acetyltransferase
VQRIDVRPITDGELGSYIRAMWAGFGRAHATDEDVEKRREAVTPLERTLACFDGDDVVGTARSYATGLTVPGGSVTAAAVTNVTVLPTHRRRGLLTSLMRLQLDQVAEAKEPVAILIASESTIYGRFGYGPATTNASIEIHQAAAAFAGPRPPGRVHLDDRDSARKAMPEVYERFQAGQPGAIDRNGRWWDLALRYLTGFMPGDTDERFRAVYRDADGRAEGYALYRLDEKWEGHHPASTLSVDDMVATTPAAYHALWRHVLEVDLVRTVKAGERPWREPLPWLLTDPRQVRAESTNDFLWVRVMDVRAALAARRYASSDRLVVEVVDGFRPDDGGRFALEGGPDGASCKRVRNRPDLVLPTQVLGASYLGEPAFADAAAAGRVEERTPGAVARAEAMFGWTPRPWCHTWF